MKTLYLDIFSGISGDMFIGAMIDLGVDASALEKELQKLGLDDWHIHVARGEKMGISGVKFDVHAHSHEHSHAHTHEHSHGAVAHTHEHSHSHSHAHDDHHHSDDTHAHEHGGDEHDHAHTHGPHGGPLVSIGGGQVELSVFETNVPPRFRLYFFDKRGKPREPVSAGTVTLETVREGKKRQTFKFKRQAGFLEATAELPEPHEFKAVLSVKQGNRVRKIETQFVEDHHHHGHGDPEHEHHHGRNFRAIREMIERSKLSPWVKEKSVAVFHRIAVAEGKIHGHPPDEVHFHEVGAVDSIVDIVGACVCLEALGKPRVLAAPVVEGVGFIRCAHGRFPLPAPATLAILGARGVAVTQCDEPHELVTPTGGALLAEFVEEFGPMRGLIAEKIGYGLGTRDNATRPNVLRAVLGAESKVQGPKSKGGALDWQTDTIAVLETNLDDISAELLGAFVERALAAGALDVFHTPVQMKKNRPGVLLTVLCAADDADQFSELLLRETTAFGVRRTSAERRKLQREIVRVKTQFGDVSVKLGRLSGRVIQASPEFESCREVADKAGVPLRTVYEAAVRALNPPAEGFSPQELRNSTTTDKHG